MYTPHLCRLLCALKLKGNAWDERIEAIMKSCHSTLEQFLPKQKSVLGKGDGVGVVAVSGAGLSVDAKMSGLMESVLFCLVFLRL